MQFTEARLNLFLLGFVIGLFAFAFVVGVAALNAVILLAVILTLMFILKYRTSERIDLAYLLGGVALAIVISILIPVLSIITLSTNALIIASVLILLIVKQ